MCVCVCCRLNTSHDLFLMFLSKSFDLAHQSDLNIVVYDAKTTEYVYQHLMFIVIYQLCIWDQVAQLVFRFLLNLKSTS